ncbi:hypothetical protein AB4175_16430 [Vibrio cyclitrophicus]
MNLLTKRGVIPSMLLSVSLMGCTSGEAMNEENIQFTVNYHDPSSSVNALQSVPFIVTYDPSQPDDLQPSARQSIVNSHVWSCQNPTPCKLIPITVFLDYEIKRNDNGYDIKGVLLTTSTIKMEPIDSSEFQLHLTSSMSKIINNGLGAQATLEFKYRPPLTDK